MVAVPFAALSILLATLWTSISPAGTEQICLVLHTIGLKPVGSCQVPRGAVPQTSGIFN